MELLSQYTFAIDSGSTTEDITCIRCKKLLNDAYQTYCGCQYCHKCIVKYLSEGERHCCGGKHGCTDEPLVLDKNVLKNAMLNRRVLRAIVICPNESCTHSDKLAQIEEHLRVCTKQSIECPYSPIGCDTEKVTKNSLLTHLANETLPHTQLLIDLIQNLRNEVDALNNKTGIAELRTAIERMKEECAEKEDRISALENESKNTKTIIDGINIGTNTVVAIGVTTVTVDKFHVRGTAEEMILSPYFYSHSNGYKLRLRIDSGGFGGGKGTHLSVYIQICKGEYDDILVWPCKYTFEMALINRSTGGIHDTKTLSYDTADDNHKHNYDKPINEDNNAHGYSKFVSVADLSPSSVSSSMIL